MQQQPERGAPTHRNGTVPFALARHGAILAGAPSAVHRTMVRGDLPATNEEFAVDANRAAGPDGANAPRAEGAEPSERSERPAIEGND